MQFFFRNDDIKIVKSWTLLIFLFEQLTKDESVWFMHLYFWVQLKKNGLDIFCTNK